ncbi:hypothetical protein V1227_26545 [Lentzea sp. DG1S-22]|uniref:hypothetical protein n=1 Tax=Lentzea sp. DG1S-22 TaxID=3108822 RepID=UPI002E796360|nr:hypothetical protein [Lentzea sp. DG1S-22]WVH78610.1 hypothetical protein V1227_26545 [Lentzea sp. DG1S-22]
MGVTELARRDIQSKVPQGMAAVQGAVVSWASGVAEANRKMADDLEELGPMGSDSRNLHERLVESLRLEAGGFDDVAARVRALAADDRFPERYEQVMASRGGNSDGVGALFKQIVETPELSEAFRSNEVCSDRQGLARAK